MAKAKTKKPVPPGMVRCNECEDGWRMVEEPGAGMIRDACYHCGNTGFITDEHARLDRMRNIAEGMGHRAMCEVRDSRNRNPDGEDFAFCAAENQCSEYEYGLGVQADYADRMLRHFEAIDKKDRLLMDCLMDAIDPPPPAKPLPVAAQDDDFDHDGDTDIDVREHLGIVPVPPPVPTQTSHSDDDIPF